MATFISLGSYTSDGIKAIKGSPGRLDAARSGLDSAYGVKIKEFYLTMGEHDFVAVVEAPDLSAAAKALMTLGGQGNVSTVTMAALTEDEFRTAVSELP
ncbi:MAG: GYD domain-containing protein [Acidimicrobiia bacterium]